jgi:HEAT repeat protein
VARDAAVARLIVIGERAVQRLLTLARDRKAAVPARVAAFQALEGIADLRAVEPALEALDDQDQSVAVAAVGVLQNLLSSPRGMDALDRLTGVAVDRERPRAIRLAAIRAVRDIGPATAGPLLKALGSDPDAAIATAAGLGPEAAVDPVYVLRSAAEGTLPDTPAALRLALTESGTDVPVAVLHQIVERVRFREGAEAGEVRAQWTAVRAAAHAALAARGSRLALYDLRETIESAREPIAVEFLGAAALIGDGNCLEALAAAYSRALEGGRRVDDWWLQRLTDVFRAIASREGLTRRHAVGKRIAGKWRTASTVLWSTRA